MNYMGPFNLTCVVNHRKCIQNAETLETCEHDAR